MRRKEPGQEYSLIVFTILSQLAVGAFCTLGLIFAWIARQQGWQVAHDLTISGWPLISAVMGIALLTSLLHLGLPSRAWRAFSNLRQSWLSREILFATLFAGFSLLFAGLQWFGWSDPSLRDILGVITGLTGLALVFVMSKAYRLRTIPTWDTWLTPVSFFVTTFLLGALGIAAGLVFFLQSVSASHIDAPLELIHAILRTMALWATILMALELCTIALNISRPAVAMTNAHSITEARFSSPNRAKIGPTMLVLRLIFVLTGIAAAGAALFLSSANDLPTQGGALLVAAFGFSLAAEAIGRLMFYKARMRVGV
jgi:anaerobic dimethyl sulfoxide reductase subunit C (anchor subunit)